MLQWPGNPGREAHRGSVWLQPGEGREVMLDLVSGRRMESKNVLYLCDSSVTGILTQEAKALSS